MNMDRAVREMVNRREQAVSPAKREGGEVARARTHIVQLSEKEKRKIRSSLCSSQAELVLVRPNWTLQP